MHRSWFGYIAKKSKTMIDGKFKYNDSVQIF